MAKLPVRLTPRSSADRIEGWGVDAEGRRLLKVRVRTRPVEGAANAALVDLLARWLDLPKSNVTLARGGQSRLKMIVIEDLDEAALAVRIEKLCSEA